jgi:hypothetical protein
MTAFVTMILDLSIKGNDGYGPSVPLPQSQRFSGSMLRCGST